MNGVLDPCLWAEPVHGVSLVLTGEKSYMGELDSSTREQVESFVTEWLSDHRVRGESVSVVAPEGTRYAEGFEARNLERNVPATEDTLFGIGSCTKSFTPLAIIQLSEADELSVEDPVNDYIPHLNGAPGNPVTIHELLTHTSGIPDDASSVPLATQPLGMGHIEVPLSRDEDFRRHVQDSLEHRVTDRETYFYYNSGYTMLEKIVEAVSGTSHTTYVEEEILSPLGMKRSTFDRNAVEADKDTVTPYVKQDDSATETGFPFDPFIYAPGGLLSSAVEMGAYLRM